MTIEPGMSTPAKAWKQPKPLWRVSGNVAMWRPLLLQLGATEWRGQVSFWDDPVEALEAAMLEDEQAAQPVEVAS